MTDNPVETVGSKALEEEFPMPELKSFMAENQAGGPQLAFTHQNAVNVLQTIARMQAEHDTLLSMLDQANRRLETVFGDLQTMINNREEMLDKFHKMLESE